MRKSMSLMLVLLVASGCGAEDAPEKARVASTRQAMTAAHTALAIGVGLHSCALLDNAKLKCWGTNWAGQLGQGDVVQRGDNAGEMGDNLKYIQLSSTASVKSFASGREHVCALLDGGVVKCWGSNAYGQLGQGNTIYRGDNAGEMGDALGSVDFGPGRTAKAIAAGHFHTCALLDNDQLKCWGRNTFGQLGLGDTLDRGDNGSEMGTNLPAVNLGTGRTAKAISAGLYHTCAVLDNAQLKCWGYNGAGQLGQGDLSYRGDAANEMGDSLLAINLGTGRTAKRVMAAFQHTCAVLDNNQLKCWGSNTSGQLGLGDTVSRGDNGGEMGDSLPAVSLGTGSDFIAASVVGGRFHTCALSTMGAVKCWGSSNVGQLGLGDTLLRGDGPNEMGSNLPAVDLGSGIAAKALAALYDHTCAILANGSVKCWGQNTYGQLGMGSTAHQGDNANEMGAWLPAVDLGLNHVLKPDLIITRLSTDANGFVNLVIENDGSVQVPAYAGKYSIAVDGQIVEIAELRSPDGTTPYLAAGASKTVVTGTRMRGVERRVTARLDIDSEIAEENEGQNIESALVDGKTNTLGDMTISDLRADGTTGTVTFTLTNLGPGKVTGTINYELKFPAQPAPSRWSETVSSFGVGSVNRQVISGVSVAGEKGATLKFTMSPGSEADTTNNRIQRVLPNGPDLALYRSLLVRNGNIITKAGSAVEWQNRAGTVPYFNWTETQKSDLDQAIVKLTRGENPGFSMRDSTTGRLTEAQAWQAYIANVAQALWVDMTDAVPWSIEELLPDAGPLLGFYAFFYYHAATNDYTPAQIVARTNPKLAFEYASLLPGLDTQQNATRAVISWIANRVRHTTSVDVPTQMYGIQHSFVPAEAILWPRFDATLALQYDHVTPGCEGTTGLLGFLVGSLNVPVQARTVALINGPGHWSPMFTSLGMMEMIHADDPYTGPLRPSNNSIDFLRILYDPARFAELTNPAVTECDSNGANCNTKGEQTSVNSFREQVRLAAEFDTDYLAHEYYSRGRLGLDTFLTDGGYPAGTFAQPFFAATERENLILDAEAFARRQGNPDGSLSDAEALQLGLERIASRFENFENQTTRWLDAKTANP
jgi:alpha-tubulin suppressor-like RCC1 family protein